MMNCACEYDVRTLHKPFKNTAEMGARPPTPCPVKTETVLRLVAANETALSVRLPSVEPPDFHESDDATQLSISFDVEVGYDTVHTDLTSPGTALGAGQRVNMPPDASGNYLHLLFDLTSDQAIDVSEVEIYLDVDDPDDVVVATLPTISTGAGFDCTTVA
ncbi:hypothetical protein Esi_0215_0017 [Ectocarpus siliculosus]|uniref:Uncharacterized protein n=1 Tax=Ectocarpus siliculosus TaxID=2880 RepID=D7FRI8_ECTSI|nr:hypothetical protein Esi_0215_0017 [Ectocarpus siliculosus]|eukprot:CBJ30779.1 hypothetical protein Esi_0215_0017 [Ectocarpus siliculosus]